MNELLKPVITAIPKPALIFAGLGFILLWLPEKLSLQPIVRDILTYSGAGVVLLTFIGLAIFNAVSPTGGLWVARGFSAGFFAAAASFATTGWLYYLVNLYPWLPTVSWSEKFVRGCIVEMVIGMSLGPALYCFYQMMRRMFGEKPVYQSVSDEKSIAASIVGNLIVLTLLGLIAGAVIYAADNVRELGATTGVTGKTNAEQGNIQFWQVWCMLFVFSTACAGTIAWRDGQRTRDAVARAMVTAFTAFTLGFWMLAMWTQAQFGDPRTYTLPPTAATGSVEPSPGPIVLVACSIVWLLVSFAFGMWPMNPLVDRVSKSLGRNT